MLLHIIHTILRQYLVSSMFTLHSESFVLHSDIAHGGSIMSPFLSFQRSLWSPVFQSSSDVTFFLLDTAHIRKIPLSNYAMDVKAHE